MVSLSGLQLNNPHFSAFKGPKAFTGSCILYPATPFPQTKLYSPLATLLLSLCQMF